MDVLHLFLLILFVVFSYYNSSIHVVIIQVFLLLPPAMSVNGLLESVLNLAKKQLEIRNGSWASLQK